MGIYTHRIHFALRKLFIQLASQPWICTCIITAVLRCKACKRESRDLAYVLCTCVFIVQHKLSLGLWATRFSFTYIEIYMIFLKRKIGTNQYQIWGGAIHSALTWSANSKIIIIIYEIDVSKTNVTLRNSRSKYLATYAQTSKYIHLEKFTLCWATRIHRLEHSCPIGSIILFCFTIVHSELKDCR